MIMTYSTAITISIPLTRADREQALIFSQEQISAEKAAQVYQNTLAVLATRSYLQMLGIPTELEESYSWNPIALLSANVADLYVPELKGRLECRVVQPGARTCFIPSEVWTDRISFVILQLNETNTEATVLGFIPEAHVENVPLSYLQPLDALIDRLSEPPVSDVVSEPPVSDVVRITDWLNNIFVSSWQSLESLSEGGIAFCSHDDTSAAQEVQASVEQLVRSTPDRTLSESIVLPAAEPQTVLVQLIQTAQDEETRFKAAELLWQIAPDHPAVSMRRAKDLGLYLAGHSVALLVVLLPIADGRIAILVRVYATGKQLSLPSGLTLTGLDENDNSFFEVMSRRQDDYIQFKFTVDLGDRFSIKVAIGNDSIVENFSV